MDGALVSVELHDPKLEHLGDLPIPNFGSPTIFHIWFT
jgi:hypothetical protein